MQRALRATVVARRAGHLTKEHVGAFAAASVPEGAPIKAALDKALPKVRKCARHSRDLPAAEPWAAHLPRAPEKGLVRGGRSTPTPCIRTRGATLLLPHTDMRMPQWLARWNPAGDHIAEHDPDDAAQQGHRV